MDKRELILGALKEGDQEKIKGIGSGCLGQALEHTLDVIDTVKGAENLTDAERHGILLAARDLSAYIAAAMFAKTDIEGKPWTDTVRRLCDYCGL